MAILSVLDRKQFIDQFAIWPKLLAVFEKAKSVDLVTRQSTK